MSLSSLSIAIGFASVLMLALIATVAGGKCDPKATCFQVSDPTDRFSGNTYWEILDLAERKINWCQDGKFGYVAGNHNWKQVRDAEEKIVGFAIYKCKSGKDAEKSFLAKEELVGCQVDKSTSIIPPSCYTEQAGKIWHCDVVAGTSSRPKELTIREVTKVPQGERILDCVSTPVKILQWILKQVTRK